MLSFFKSSRRESQQINSDGNGSFDHDSTEKVRGKQSIRDYFRKKKVELKSNRSRNSQILQKTNHRPVPASPSPVAPSTPMSDTNKPLPLRPAPGTPGTPQAEPPLKPTKKLEKIISALAVDDLHKLFSGAPQFFARSEGHHTGAPHPSVAFPWNSELQIRDLCDHVQIHDEAWACVTVWPHITLLMSKNPDAAKEHRRKQTAHFHPRCKERPNMLSMQGIERGTIGYGAALEMGVADALEDVAVESSEVISEHRRRFLNDKEGLRPLADSSLIDRLCTVSETYHDDPNKHRRPTVALYTELFTQTLYPPTRVTDSGDPYSLQVQIEALVNVLAAPHVWVDFSLVEWRIRLGQILWGVPESDMADEIAVNNESLFEPGTQKYWLLLQILLSCELLLRLDAISMNIDHGLQLPRPAELHRFDKMANMSVRWSLLLARQWLENIRIAKRESEVVIEKKAAPGWLATLTGVSGNETKPTETVDLIRFQGRYQDRQLSGLLHFARNMRWPNLDAITAKVSSNGITITDSVSNTPAVGTPLTMSTQRSSSYFSSRRPGARRGLSIQKNMSALIHPAGWLSNSYISGLMLPGEGLSHFLISTLLEHDEEAVEKLGDEANLYGGFVYSGRSFWSTACIVGRVLAAKKGTSECIGWISSDVVPKGIREGWVDIEVEVDSSSDSDRHTDKPRIWHKTEIETDGNVIGGADASSVLPGDFVLPSDESVQKPLAVTFESLDLFASVDSVHTSMEETTPLTSVSDDSPRIQTYSAMLRFVVETDGEEKKEVNVALAHDPYFVTAHPCIPSTHSDVLKSPTTPSFHTVNESPAGSPGLPASPSLPNGHPLHKAFTYTRVPILDLLSHSSSLPLSSLLSPPQSPDPGHSSTHTTSSSIRKILVIDCMDTTTTQFPLRPMPSPHVGHKHSFGSDLEMLARALCAERGWNALVSRRGRNCVACSVREASALGWRIVLRLA